MYVFPALISRVATEAEYSTRSPGLIATVPGSLLKAWSSDQCSTIFPSWFLTSTSMRCVVGNSSCTSFFDRFSSFSVTFICRVSGSFSGWGSIVMRSARCDQVAAGFSSTFFFSASLSSERCRVWKMRLKRPGWSGAPGTGVAGSFFLWCAPAPGAGVAGSSADRRPGAKNAKIRIARREQHNFMGRSLRMRFPVCKSHSFPQDSSPP